MNEPCATRRGLAREPENHQFNFCVRRSPRAIFRSFVRRRPRDFWLGVCSEISRGGLRPDPSRGSHSTPRDRRVRRTVARARGETNPADPRRVVARARRLAVGSKTRLARSCAPRTRWRGWRWPPPRRARRRATHSSPARDLAPGEPRASSAPSSRSASLSPSARAASPPRERARPTTRARSRAGSHRARVTLRRRRPRDPPRGSPPRPRAPRAPSRRARVVARMRPTRRRRGRRRGRLLRGRRPRRIGNNPTTPRPTPVPSPSEQTPAPEIKYKPPGVSKRRSSSSPSVVVNPIPPSQRVPQPRASDAPRDQSATATDPPRRSQNQKRRNRRPRTSPPRISSAVRTRWRARRRVCVAPYRRYHPRRRRRRS